MTMFNSVKKHIIIPITIIPTIINGAGDKTDGASIATYCYPVGKVTKVLNVLGVEVLSNMHFYMFGSEVVNMTDRLLFNTKQYNIQTIETFYKDAIIDILVVYV